MGVLMTQDSSWPSSAGRQRVGFGNKLQNIVPQIAKAGQWLPSYLKETERGRESEESQRVLLEINAKNLELGHVLVNSYVILTCCSNKAIIYSFSNPTECILLLSMENIVVTLSCINFSALWINSYIFEYECLIGVLGFLVSRAHQI